MILLCKMKKPTHVFLQWGDEAEHFTVPSGNDFIMENVMLTFDEDTEEYALAVKMGIIEDVIERTVLAPANVTLN